MTDTERLVVQKRMENVAIKHGKMNFPSLSSTARKKFWKTWEGKIRRETRMMEILLALPDLTKKKIKLHKREAELKAFLEMQTAAN